MPETVMSPLGVPFSWLAEDQVGLVCHLDPFDSNQFMFCVLLSYVILAKVGPLPSSLLFHPSSEILLPHSYGNLKDDGPSSVTASRRAEEF